MSAKRLVVLVAIVVCVAGLAMGQTEWVLDPNNPVIGPGDAGPWDVNGPWTRAAVFDGTMYHLYFTGSGENGLPNDMGHATSPSPDAEEWTMDPANPVLTRGGTGEWDELRLDGAAVVHDGSIFHMWYSGWGDDEFERVGYATSPDGSVWTKHAANPVMDVGEPGSWDEDIIRPTSVLLENGVFRMWYAGGDWAGNEFRTSVGYAKSSDGVSWTKNPDPVLGPSEYPGAWDPIEVGHPYVVFDGSIYHMWYTGGIETTSSIDLSIGYAWSGDGFAWTKHRYNPVLSSTDSVLYHSPVLHDGTKWHMWYSSWDGATDEMNHATSTDGPGVPALDNWRIIPAAAVASGAEGAFYQTDVDVSNADDQTAEYEFMWFPRGEDNSEPTASEPFTLGGGKSARYANVLAEVFDLGPDSLGALGIKATSPDLLAMSRTYNLPAEGNGGTFGQAMEAITSSDFIGYGESRRILFGSEGAEMRTNIGCQNGTDRSTVVYLDLFDDEGVSLGREMLILKPLGNEQVNRIFDGHNPVNGYVDVSLVQPGRSVYCYGSVLDNVTSDPTTIPPQ